MPEKDTPYFELRDALAAGGCPLCRLGNAAAHRYIDSVLYEGMTDVPARTRLRNSQGLCREHAWQMTRNRGSVLGTALVYRDVLNDIIAALESRPRGRGGLRALPEPQAPCPACAVAGDEAARAATVLLSHLADPELAALFQTAGGLCLPHLRLALGRARDPQAETLRGWQAQALTRLRDEVSELIRKHDYRFAGEPIGAEADSWQRAVARIVGEQSQ